MAFIAAGCGSSAKSSGATTAAGATTTRAGGTSATTAGSAGTTGAGTSAAPATTSAPKGTLKIGVLIDQSGPTAASHAQNLEGIQLAVDKINAAGGAGGYKLELDVADDASKSAQDVSQSVKLIEQDHVVAILGPMLSGGALAVIENMKTSNKFVPMVGTAGDPSILHGDPATGKYYFNASLDTQLFAKDAVDVLNKQVKPKTMGSIFTKVVSAESAAKISQQEAESMGIKWVGSEGADLTQTDLLAATRKLKDEGAESIVMWLVTPASVLGWLRAREQLSWNVPWAIADVTLAPNYASVPQLIEGAYVGSMCDPRTDGFKAMLADYQKAHNKPLDVGAYDNTGSMYNGTLLLGNAISRATDPTNPDSIRDALETTKNFPSSCHIPTTLSLAPDDHVMAGAYPFFQFTGGQKVYLAN
jgi:branched-chain amino acid transport system substrate-binding protein